MIINRQPPKASSLPDFWPTGARPRRAPRRGKLLRYNAGVRCGRLSQPLSRRGFLRLAGLLSAASLAPHLPGRGPAAGWLAAAPPTPEAPTPSTDEPREYFVPLADYHELPAESYENNLIRPLEIIVHWDGNRRGRDWWLVSVTYQTLSYLDHSAHFAVDYQRVWQMLPMYRTLVQESHGAQGYNWEAINVELAGVDFDLAGNAPPESEVRLAVSLVSRLMDHYQIAFEHVVGHFERDAREKKIDPGVSFMADFRERLRAYRASLSPLKTQLLADG